MPTIIFATCLESPQIQPSDQLVADALIARGCDVAPAPWNGDQAPFESADLIVVRSTWDYPSAPAAFRDWLVGLAAYSRVVNPPSVMRDNLSKRYLMRLQAQGAPLPPTRFVAPAARDIVAAMASLEIDEAVVKPIVGATASGLSVVRRGDVAAIEEAAARLGHAAIVQPLIPAIRERGETSFIFIDGEFTHAVVKHAKAGDIRVQEEHGGRSALATPSETAIAAARGVLALFPGEPVYARVDAIVENVGGLDGGLQLMEVELIEPELFFTHAPEAAGRFAAALLKKLR